MSDYTPDRWVVIKIPTDSKPLYKVFACWYGGYGGSDSWKINSGITKVTENNNYYQFEGYSGSIYHCYKDSYGTNFYGGSVLNGFIEESQRQGITLEIMPENTNWMEINYDELI
jgi:hypothetical protein